MCLNRARQRRRLRRLLEDWRNMFDHGLNADMSADLASWMTQRGWRWMPLDESGEDPQARTPGFFRCLSNQCVYIVYI
jgi:hypothetical protein